jgi:error-prone DNA polymerase
MPEAANPKHRPSVPAPPTVRGTSAHPYAELDVTSNFSFLRGASHPDELVYRAAELGHKAIAFTDLNSLAGIVRAHQAAETAQIKLCVGTRLRFTDAPDVLVWVENRAGYANLCRLLTLGKRRAEKGSCILHLDDLLNAPMGLLAALVTQRIDPELEPVNSELLIDAADAMKNVFGTALSLAVSRHGSPLDEPMIIKLNALSQRFHIPLVATNQVHYHTEGRQPLQDVLTCIRHGCTIREAGFKLFPNGEYFLKSPEEMHRLFADLPQELRRTIEIAERCNFSLKELQYEYPDEIVPSGKTSASYLSELAC